MIGICLHIFFMLIQDRTTIATTNILGKTEKQRVLGIINAFNMKHIDPQLMILNTFHAMCESQWTVKAVMLSNVTWSNSLRQNIRERYFCYSIDDYLDIEFLELSVQQLHIAQRVIVSKELHNFDMFAYLEDDMILTHSHIVAHLGETMKWFQQLPTKEHFRYGIGLIRFRRKIYTAPPKSIKPTENDLIQKDCIEEINSRWNPMCISKHKYVHVFGNPHQSMWLLTQQQIMGLHQKCNFLNHTLPPKFIPRYIFRNYTININNTRFILIHVYISL